MLDITYLLYTTDSGPFAFNLPPMTVPCILRGTPCARSPPGPDQGMPGRFETHHPLSVVQLSRRQTFPVVCVLLLGFVERVPISRVRARLAVYCLGGE